MFRVDTNPLSAQIAPLDKQVVRSDEPLPLGNHLLHIFSGKRGSGKSTLMLNLLCRTGSPYHKYFHNVFMCSPTARRDPKWNALVEEVDREGHFYDKLDDDICDQIIRSVEEYNDTYLKGVYDKIKKKWIKPKDKPFNLLILDDCLSALPMSQQKSRINDLFVNSRHMKLSVWISTQKYNKLNTVCRSNCDLLSFYATDNEKEFQSLADDWSIPINRLKRLYTFATDEDNSFLHISFVPRRPVFFKRFDRIIEEDQRIEEKEKEAASSAL